jgi:hypothetical protein
VYAGSQGVNSAQAVFWVQVVNRGRKACVIRGAPWIALPRHAPPIEVGPVSLGAQAPRPGAFGLAPGKRSSSTIFVTYPCTAFGLETTLRIGARVPWSSNAVHFDIPSCRRPMSIGVTTFYPPQPQEHAPRPWPLRVMLEAPSSARAGETLRYRVRVTNASDTPFRFPFCPPLIQTIADIHWKGQITTLNCKPVGTLRAGKSVLMDMELPLPSDLAAGNHTLEWLLETVVDGKRQARAPLEVAAG